jgi:hypothetical protein
VLGARVELLEMGSQKNFSSVGTRGGAVFTTFGCDEEEEEGRTYYFAEIHRLYTFASQGRTDGRRGRCLARADDQFDDLVALYYSFRHDECVVCGREVPMGCGSLMVAIRVGGEVG